ncbi:MAG: NADAR family protein [Pseudomonadota bacterium]
MNLTPQYVFFWSGPFSQWQRARFTMDGVDFNTAEQAMMYGKAKIFGDDNIAEQILATSDARKQKALGRKVKGFDGAKWDRHKEDIVLHANRAKFGQNKGLRRKLFQTGDRLLVEASPLDTIWGIGLDEAKARETPEDLWPGQNLLGKILTQVREELRAEHPDEAAAVAQDAADA